MLIGGTVLIARAALSAMLLSALALNEPSTPRLDPVSLERGVTLLDGWSARDHDEATPPGPASSVGPGPSIDSLGDTDRLQWFGETRWYTRELTIPAAVRGLDVAALLELRGTAQVFVDGKLAANLGSMVHPETGEPLDFGSRNFSLRLPEKPRALLAIRYDDRVYRGFDWMEPSAGFRLTLGTPEAIERLVMSSLRSSAGQQMFFLGAFGGQALLHLLLFLFARNITSNGYFSLSTAFSAALVGLHFQRILSEDPDTLGLITRLWNPVLIATMVLLLRFVEDVFEHRQRKRFLFVASLGVALIIYVVIRPGTEAFTELWWFHLLTLGMCVHATLSAIRRGWSGAWIIGLGLLGLAGGLVWQWLLVVGALEAPFRTFPIAYYGVGALLFSVSTYLAFQFARLGRAMRERLQEVERLSRQNLENERSARQQAIERALLEADNERKTAELESARELQLSLLPKSLPSLDHLEIAAAIQTATEVGGDYYDFQVSGRGVLTCAIGDAAGHGARAGALVSLMKGMFAEFSSNDDLPSFLEGSNEVVRSMDVAALRVSMALLQLRYNRLLYAAAGMPPAWIHRGDEVEELLVAGIPLGGMDRTEYRRQEVRIAKGDTILLMSDGLPELPNEDGEPLGYERLQDKFLELGRLPLQEMLDQLNGLALEWGSGTALADDVTLVAIRVIDDPPRPRRRVRFGM